MMHAPFFPFMLHAFFCGLLFFGILLLFIWLAKFATKGQLKKWIVLMFVFGTIGAIATSFWAKSVIDTSAKNGSGYTMMYGNWDKETNRGTSQMRNWNK